MFGRFVVLERRAADRQAVAVMAVGLAAIANYLPTVAPTITLHNGGGDGPELVRAAWALGIPHPTGYPLWVILAHALTWLPVGEPAYRVALLSAVAASLAVCFTVLSSIELLLATGHAPPASLASFLPPFLGGIVLACAPLFWQQATIPETYALSSCLIAAGLWLLLRWLRGATALWLVTLVLGLALANHLMSLAFGGGVVVAIFVRKLRPSGKDLARAGLPLLLTPSLYLLLLLRARAHPVANWGDPQTLGALWAHVSAREYHHFFTSRPLDETLLEVARWPRRLRDQFSAPGAVLLLWGLSVVVIRAPRAGSVLLATLAVDIALAAGDAAPAAQSYLQVSYVALSIALGPGMVVLSEFFSTRRPLATRAALLGETGCLVLAAYLQVHTRASVDFSADHTLESEARSDLAAVPHGALLVTEGDNPTFALWYLQDVLGYRGDVVVWTLNLANDPWYGAEMHRRYPDVVPADLPPEQDAAANLLIAQNLPERPVFTTRSDQILLSPYQPQPAGRLFRLAPAGP